MLMMLLMLLMLLTVLMLLLMLMGDVSRLLRRLEDAAIDGWPLSNGWKIGCFQLLLLLLLLLLLFENQIC